MKKMHAGPDHLQDPGILRKVDDLIPKKWALSKIMETERCEHEETKNKNFRFSFWFAVFSSKKNYRIWVNSSPEQQQKPSCSLHASVTTRSPSHILPPFSGRWRTILAINDNKTSTQNKLCSPKNPTWDIWIYIYIYIHYRCTFVSTYG